MTGKTAKLPKTRSRFATVDDAPDIARIYNQGIAERVATFETDLRSAEQIAAMLVEKGTRYPTIVVERQGKVVAWATGARYRARRCYEGIAEHSVYVDKDARGTGAGREALSRLIEVYESRGFWKLVSRIFPENTASLALHDSVGFRQVGTYFRHGKVDGVWRDSVVVERLMGEAAKGLPSENIAQSSKGKRNSLIVMPAKAGIQSSAARTERFHDGPSGQARRRRKS